MFRLRTLSPRLHVEIFKYTTPMSIISRRMSLGAFEIVDAISRVSRYYQINQKNKSEATRRWDKETTAFIHPVWSAVTALLEEKLPWNLREILFYGDMGHDLHEDFGVKSIDFLPPAFRFKKNVRTIIKQVSFLNGGFGQQIKEANDQVFLARLLELIEKTNNLMDNPWMSEQKLKECGTFVETRCNEIKTRFPAYADLRIIHLAQTLCRRAIPAPDRSRSRYPLPTAIEIADLVEAAVEQRVSDKLWIQKWRQEKHLPYLVYPLWAATTLLTEVSLPKEIRSIGFRALLLRDVIQTDTFAPRGAQKIWFPAVQSIAHNISFDSFEQEEKNIWNHHRSKLNCLLSLYEKTAYLMSDLVMSPLERARYLDHVRKLGHDAEQNFGPLNIVHFARALRTFHSISLS